MIYPSDKQNFPLGIKMQLIPELQQLTNLAAYDKAIQLQTRQAQFLETMETYRIWEDNVHHPLTPPLYNILREMTLAHQSATEGDPPLFHAISPMTTKDGYLVRYLP